MAPGSASTTAREQRYFAETRARSVGQVTSLKGGGSSSHLPPALPFILNQLTKLPCSLFLVPLPTFPLLVPPALSFTPVSVNQYCVNASHSRPPSFVYSSLNLPSMQLLLS